MLGFMTFTISIFIKAKDPVRARELFQDIVHPNVKYYITLLKAYSMLKRPGEVMKLLGLGE